MATLEHIRQEITELDCELLALLAKRKRLSLEVAKNKQAEQRPIRDTAREQDLLETLIRQGKPLGLSAQYIQQIYHTIIEDSVLSQQSYLQEQLNAPLSEKEVSIAFLGPRGSYSSLAAHKYLRQHSAQIVEISCSNFDQVATSVEMGQAQYGILPIENTSSGSINEVYDLMQNTSLSIVGELTLPIEHCLLAAVETTIDAIETIYAHPQPLLQCSNYLAKLNAVRHEYCDSSSAAMGMVKNLASPHAAALGSAAGGAMFGLHPIASGLANQTDNITRFIIVARKAVDVAPQIPAKTTLIMSTEHKAGSLVEALLVLKNNEINMTKLESRPIQGNPWEEMFYVDVTANVTEPRMQSALKQLDHITKSLKVLGCYPCDDVPPTELPAFMLEQGK